MALRFQPEDREHPATCPACGGHSFTTLLSEGDVAQEKEWLTDFYARRLKDPSGAKDKADFTQYDITNIVTCDRCGTVLRNPQPTPKELERRYRSDEYGPETLKRLHESERAFFRSKVREATTYLPSAAKVLEVGSFVGAFLVEAKEAGLNAAGIDIGRETSAFCHAKGLEVLEGDLLNVQLARDWDGIFIWNTFDQLAHPGETLVRAADILVPGGLLVLRVPNGQFEKECLRVRRNPKHFEHVMLAQVYNNFLTFPYLVGYTSSSLSGLLCANGFEIIQIKGDNLVRLADDTVDEATAGEEAKYKKAVRLLCNNHTAPWIDIYARKN